MEVEVEVWKCGGDGAAEDSGETLSCEEVEDGVFGTCRVLDDGKNSGYGAAEVRDIECHRDVD